MAPFISVPQPFGKPFILNSKRPDDMTRKAPRGWRMYTARLRQTQAFLRAKKEDATKFFFEPFDVKRHRGLGQREFASRGGEGAGAGCSLKDLEMVEVHAACHRSFSSSKMFSSPRKGSGFEARNGEPASTFHPTAIH